MAEGSEYVKNTYSLKALTQFIGDHPEYMSVVSFNVNNPDSGIYFEADKPRTLGILSNIFLILEYERQVEKELIDPMEVVSLEEIRRLRLPKVGDNAHNSAIEFLQDSEKGLITLDRVATASVQFSDIAISDYLWFRLGHNSIEQLFNSLDLYATDHPLPFAGLYLFIHPDISDTSRSYSEEEIIELAERFRNDDSFNKEIKQLFDDKRLNLSFIQERNALSYFPHTTAFEMANLMARLYKNELISVEVSERVKEKMNWVKEGEAIERSFTEYGAIYDNRMGMLSGIDFGTSVYDGHTSAQAVFFDKLPVAFWLHLSANHMQEDYQQRVIWDPALYETTLNEINN